MPGGGREAGSEVARRDPARWLRRRLRGALFALASRWLPSQAPQPLPDLAQLHRVLLVHVSQRLGNTLLVTPGLDALLERLAGARVVFVGGASASQVLEGYRLDRIEALSRSDLLLPWRLVALLRRLRAENFDAAIHLGTSSRSLGPILVGGSGARYRIGRHGDGPSLFFTTPLPRDSARHKVDAALGYLASLGAPSRGERRMLLRAEETAAAEAELRSRIGPGPEQPVAFFVGARARKGKSWALANFAAVAGGLRARGIPLVVFLGPEERSREREIRRAIGEAAYISGKNVREVASMLSCCGAVLTPDAGTLHLAIAAGAPTAAVFRKSNSDRWGPRPPQGDVVHDPDDTGAERALETLLRLYDAGRAQAVGSPEAARLLDRSSSPPG